MTAPARWGVVATIKASVGAILDFAAWHLDQGAAHLFLYLDDDNPEAEARLAGHPLITVTRTDDAHWQARLGRTPPKHQLRQARNADHAYGLADGLDWLAHIDVDEFLLSPTRPLGEVLAALPASVRAARVRPQEVLAREDGADDGEILCKAFLPPSRRGLLAELYPTWGHQFRGGFLSHVAGKLLIRTGQPGIGIRIHDIFENGERIAETVELDDVALIHDHASDWADWLAHYRYRHAKGSYRAELKGAVPADQGGLSPHDLLHQLEQDRGEAGLRAFFDEICLASPRLVSALERHDLLCRHRLDLPRRRARHFPE